ncbi:hypothetical protein NA56DRAFT_479024 [Hyaloscypha hepaticicola]|uniref:Nickel/cobalt efflux system n=1 Tax=Hyaloscypha hepaticicola TaxID=2082293 RepID=A0A2J6PF84_9HELO|nr:hypothetical protein NA56DRAFT_479024 [Hyaloscypha hepaticicola]
MVRILNKVLQVVNRPWKMYPVGVLFGLGFDTSSEIAVIAGMCLIDTCDGALMMTLYTSTSLARDTVAILYYSIVLTAITVIVATCIGTIQLLSLVAGVANPSGKFWDGVNTLYYTGLGETESIGDGGEQRLKAASCKISTVRLQMRRALRRWIQAVRYIQTTETRL